MPGAEANAQGKTEASNSKRKKFIHSVQHASVPQFTQATRPHSHLGDHLQYDDSQGVNIAGLAMLRLGRAGLGSLVAHCSNIRRAGDALLGRPFEMPHRLGNAKVGQHWLHALVQQDVLWL